MHMLHMNFYGGGLLNVDNMQGRPDSRGGGGLGDAVSQLVYCTVHIANSRYMRTSHVLARRVGVQEDLHSSFYAL